MKEEEIYGREEYLLPLPSYVSWIIKAVYTVAFTLVLLACIIWLGTIFNYS